MGVNVYFQLTNNQNIFQPGDYVNGHVNIQLQNALTSIKEVAVNLLGKSEVDWTEASRRSSRRYSKSEEYFNLQVQVFKPTAHEYEVLANTHASDAICSNVYSFYIFDCKDLNEDVLVGGLHQFAFSFHLPTQIPDSFDFHDGADATVTYILKCTIHRKGFYFNISKKQNIIVRGNHLQSYIDSATEASSDRYLCCCCCRHGPIKGEIQLNKSVFSQGEPIFANASIDNLSKTSISSVQIVLSREISLNTHSRHISYKEVLSSIGNDKCRKQQSLSLTNRLIQLPSYLPPSTLPYCNLINIDYYIELVAVTSMIELDYKLPLLIKINSNPYPTGLQTRFGVQQLEEPPSYLESFSDQIVDEGATTTT